MCIVPKAANDMMQVGRLQGFDVSTVHDLSTWVNLQTAPMSRGFCSYYSGIPVFNSASFCNERLRTLEDTVVSFFPKLSTMLQTVCWTESTLCGGYLTTVPFPCCPQCCRLCAGLSPPCVGDMWQQYPSLVVHNAADCVLDWVHPVWGIRDNSTLPLLSTMLQTVCWTESTLCGGYVTTIPFSCCP